MPGTFASAFSPTASLSSSSVASFVAVLVSASGVSSLSSDFFFFSVTAPSSGYSSVVSWTSVVVSVFLAAAVSSSTICSAVSSAVFAALVV